MMMKLLLLLDDGLRAPIQSREKWSNRQEVRDRRKERAGPALNVNILYRNRIFWVLTLDFGQIDTLRSPSDMPPFT